ncbi:hypothetical protein CPB86DRAFT_702417 [Serendipita vermifera]|nr:hypothetical protein CPB86DRAFT_702417 [Serendipita vermifera]
MNEQTDLTLPKSLPYPVKVVKCIVSPGDKIQRGSPLLDYSFKYKSLDEPELETRYGTWESHVDGVVNFWNVVVGDEISKNYGPVLVVTEPCKHGLQIAGLCAYCGMDMTTVDYMSYSAAERANIKMDHSGEGPLMSLEEAARIEKENTTHLLEKRKLSLIVDLDQTILHATMDPTVGEWMRAKQAFDGGSTTPPPESVNWPALKDVVKFQLADEYRGAIQTHPNSTWYYVKPRPGLKRFMSKISELYEMHVYTMGTRSYANAVCAALDPQGVWFGSRILTRSESGSDRFKSLKRLFPSDQSMVVIIDDRGDVWEYSPNLVRVVAFEFFVGTGDINSSFLPKLQPANVGEAAAEDTSKDGAQVEGKEDGVQDSEDIVKRKSEQIAEVAKQLEERPLAKAQEQLEERHHDPIDPERQNSTGQRKDSNEVPIVDVKPVLNEDDRELDRVEALLCETHRRFYERHDAHLRGRSSSLPDVSLIVPEIKAETFKGCHIVFSGIIPLQTRPEDSGVWKTATSFGATCHRDLNPQVTHLVVAKPGTAKAEMALKRGNIFVVEMKWFDNSIIKWRRQPEKDYLIDRKRSTPRATTPEMSGHGGEGTDGKTSHSKDSEDKAEEDSVETLPEGEQAGEAETMELNIDWAQIDKELEDELGSEIDEESETGSHTGAFTDDGTPEVHSDMEDVKSTSRGIKRRRSQTSTPTTPSKLRLSTTIPYKEGTPSPPNSKKKRIEETTVSVKTTSSTDGAARKDEQSTESGPSQDDASTSNIRGPNDTEDDGDDDDDFLAREMAEGGETDEWDSSDDA